MQEDIIKLLTANPGLKGKEVAKRIGSTKKEVNLFLHEHKNVFKQDENYCWFIADIDYMKIKFEDNQWVDRDSFENSLLEVESPLNSDSGNVIFIVPEGCKILLDAAARLLSLCNQLILKKKSVTIDFSGCKSALSYFDRIGFIDQLDKEVNILPERPTTSKATKYKGNSENVVEFGSIDPGMGNKELKELIGQLSDRFVQQSDSKYETAASTVFSELIGNVKEHSDTFIPGFAALQKYEGRRKHIQTVVSDSGLGIANTLKPSLEAHHPDLYKSRKNPDFDIELVIAALTKGEISRLGAGRGLGFKSSREQAMKFDAELSVRQECFSLDFIYKNGVLTDIKKKKNLPIIPGTHLCFDFFVD